MLDEHNYSNAEPTQVANTSHFDVRFWSFTDHS